MGAAVVSLSAVVRSEPSHQLEWSGPAGCDDPSLLRRRFEQLIGEQPLEQQLVAKSSIARRGEAWVVDMTIEYGGHQGSRQLEAASCEELVEAAALLLALTVGRQPRSEPEQPEPAPAPPSPPSSEPRRRTSVQPGKQSESSPWQLAVEASGVLGFGAVRGLDTGFGAAAGGGRGRAQLTWVATGWLPAHVDELDVEGATTEVLRLDLGVRGCFWLLRAEIDWGPCLTLGGSYFNVRTDGIDLPGRARQWLPGLAVGFPLRIPLTRWAFLHTTPALSLTHPHDFVVHGIEQTAFSVRVLAAEWSLGVGAAFL